VGKETGRSAVTEWNEAGTIGRFRAEEHSPLRKHEDANTLSKVEDRSVLLREESDHTAVLKENPTLTVEGIYSKAPSELDDVILPTEMEETDRLLRETDERAPSKETGSDVFLQESLLNELVASTPLFAREALRNSLVKERESGSAEWLPVEDSHGILEDKERGPSVTVEWNEADSNARFKAEEHIPRLKQEDVSTLSKVNDSSVLLTEELDHTAVLRENSTLTVEGIYSKPPPELDDVILPTEMEETEKNAPLNETGSYVVLEEYNRNGLLLESNVDVLWKEKEIGCAATSEGEEMRITNQVRSKLIHENEPLLQSELVYQRGLIVQSESDDQVKPDGQSERVLQSHSAWENDPENKSPVTLQSNDQVHQSGHVVESEPVVQVKHHDQSVPTMQTDDHFKQSTGLVVQSESNGKSLLTLQSDDQFYERAHVVQSQPLLQVKLGDQSGLNIRSRSVDGEELTDQSARSSKNDDQLYQSELFTQSHPDHQVKPLEQNGIIVQRESLGVTEIIDQRAILPQRDGQLNQTGNNINNESVLENGPYDHSVATLKNDEQHNQGGPVIQSEPIDQIKPDGESEFNFQSESVLEKQAIEHIDGPSPKNGLNVRSESLLEKESIEQIAPTRQSHDDQLEQSELIAQSEVIDQTIPIVQTGLALQNKSVPQINLADLNEIMTQTTSTTATPNLEKQKLFYHGDPQREHHFWLHQNTIRPSVTGKWHTHDLKQFGCDNYAYVGQQTTTTTLCAVNTSKSDEESDSDYDDVTYEEAKIYVCRGHSNAPSYRQDEPDITTADQRGAVEEQQKRFYHGDPRREHHFWLYPKTHPLQNTKWNTYSLEIFGCNNYSNVKKSGVYETFACCGHSYNVTKSRGLGHVSEEEDGKCYHGGVDHNLFLLQRKSSLNNILYDTYDIERTCDNCEFKSQSDGGDRVVYECMGH
ncbi:unnamed protein product, partial [Didymodactylos carnosus]